MAHVAAFGNGAIHRLALHLGKTMGRRGQRKGHVSVHSVQPFIDPNSAATAAGFDGK